MFSQWKALACWLCDSEVVYPARAHLETFCSLNSGRQELDEEQLTRVFCPASWLAFSSASSLGAFWFSASIWRY